MKLPIRPAFLACLALHAPRFVGLADFFSILLEVRGILACVCVPLKAKRRTHVA
jgi:hypothetical protein